MSLIRRNSSETPQPVRKQRLEVSPYENPELVLEIIGKICGAQPIVDTDVFYNSYRKMENRMLRQEPSIFKFLEEDESVQHLAFDRFSDDLVDAIVRIPRILAQHQTEKRLHIVLAGGFSAGKSSFLNRITGQRALLPTGTQPVSVVKTYLNCDRKTKEVSVQGINMKNVLVNLPLGVLQAIQHANRSQVHLAAVLDKLLVNLPTDSAQLDGITFIDTPGYNNSKHKNDSNGKTDEETATEAFAEGDVLFWVVDCERGTLPAEDLAMLAKFEKKPKVIIFNKADKKGMQECRKIVDAAWKQLGRYVDMHEVVDIMAFSSLDNKMLYARRHLSINDLINAVRKEAKMSDLLEVAKKEVGELFDLEIAEQEDEMLALSDQRNEWLGKKNEEAKNAREGKKNNITFGQDVNLVMASYKELKSAFEDALSIGSDVINRTWDDAQDIINRNESKFVTHDDISRICRYLGSYVAKKEEEANRLYEVRVYNDDFLNTIAEWVANDQDTLNSNIDERIENISNFVKGVEAEVKQRRHLKEKLASYKDVYCTAVSAGITNYQRKFASTPVKVEEKARIDVFDAIERRDYKDFLRSFEHGVELSECKDGFTPLTYAAHLGNTAMVQFLLEHGADYAGLDERGYNALHTALEAGAKGICEILLKKDTNLRNIPALLPNGTTKTIQEIIAQRSFQQWAEQNFA